MRYFIGNWKMFGIPKSISILNKINSFYTRDKNKNALSIEEQNFRKWIKGVLQK